MHNKFLILRFPEKIIALLMLIFEEDDYVSTDSA